MRFAAFSLLFFHFNRPIHVIQCGLPVKQQSRAFCRLSLRCLVQASSECCPRSKLTLPPSTSIPCIFFGPGLLSINSELLLKASRQVCSHAGDLLLEVHFQIRKQVRSFRLQFWAGGTYSPQLQCWSVGQEFSKAVSIDHVAISSDPVMKVSRSSLTASSSTCSKMNPHRLQPVPDLHVLSTEKLRSGPESVVVRAMRWLCPSWDAPDASSGRHNVDGKQSHDRRYRR